MAGGISTAFPVSLIHGYMRIAIPDLAEPQEIEWVLPIIFASTGFWCGGLRDNLLDAIESLIRIPNLTIRKFVSLVHLPQENSCH